jgi:putative Holliday junction resolvase
LRVIALDVGEKRIGVAASDPLGRTAQPLETIKRDERFVERLLELIAELGAERLVVGLPLSLDGTESSQAGAVRRFAEEIQERLNIPVTFVDERLSSREANSYIAEGGRRPGRERGATDRVAAALILRLYLDSVQEE